jgi:hypothetical protein
MVNQENMMGEVVRWHVNIMGGRKVACKYYDSCCMMGMRLVKFQHKPNNLLDLCLFLASDKEVPLEFVQQETFLLSTIVAAGD